jgi:hypothetical protein
MAKVKNYGLVGLGNSVQLGKMGPHILADSDDGSITFTAEDQLTLTKVKGAAAESADEFVTKSQLDSVQFSEATFSDNFDITTTVLNLGTIPAGTKTVITTLNVSNVFDSDSNASATVGVDSNPGLLMSSSYNDLTATGSYQTVTTVSFVAEANINIYVTANGSQLGAGTIVVSYY